MTIYKVSDTKCNFSPPKTQCPAPSRAVIPAPLNSPSYILSMKSHGIKYPFV